MKRLVLMVTLLALLMAAPVLAQPTDPAPDPALSGDEVDALYSDSYTPATTVDTWSATWDMADFQEIQIQGNATLEYTNLTFAGIEFISQPLDVDNREFFHFDVFTPDPTDGAFFRVKLVDFGPDGMYAGGDDSEHEIYLQQSDGLEPNTWVSYALPMADFSGLASAEHLAQLIYSSDELSTVYIDNIYFSGEGGGATDPEPSEPAPTPTQDPVSTISLFSNAYDDVMVDTWSAAWDNANVTDVQVGGDDVKKYTSFVFAGVEFISQPIDATEMTHFRMDIWFPGPYETGDVFKIKLVDFGADGLFGGGDDTEHELVFDAATEPGLVAEEWVSFDIPLDDFVNMTGRGAVAQLIMVSDPGANTVYVDNVYFYNEALGVDEAAAATPVDHALVNVYPNPFNPTTTVQVTLAQASEMQVSVVNMLGHEVARLASGQFTAGTHALAFDGSRLTSGVYLVRAVVDGQPLAMRKMMLLK